MKKFFLLDPKLLLFGFTISFFSSYGQTFFISIFNLEIRNYYKLSDGEFGLLYALATITSSLILVWFAKLIDRIDLRIYSFIICLGLAIACLGMFYLMDYIFFLFLIIFSLRFFGQGAMSHAGDTTMSRYFDIDRGKALSVVSLGMMLGFMVYPLIVVNLMENFNWQIVWLLSFISVLIICVPIIFYSLWNQDIRHKKFISELITEPNQKSWTTKEIFFDKKFYIYLPISIAAPFITTGLIFHQIFIINQKGWSLEMLAQSYILFGFFSIIGLIVVGPTIDKFETKKLVVLILMPLFFAVLVLIFFNSYISIFFYMSLIGISIGIFFPFIGALWAELWGLENLGGIKAVLHACSVFASALAPLIFGLLIDFGFGVLSMSILTLIVILLSTFLPLKYNYIE